MPDEKLNPFEIAQQQLDQAADLLKLDPATHQILREPMRELHLLIPVRMDSGEVKVFKGFRVQHTPPGSSPKPIGMMGVWTLSSPSLDNTWSFNIVLAQR